MLWLSVIFVGILGQDTARLASQLGSLLHHDAKVEAAPLPASDLRALTRHAESAAAIIRKLHVDGVIGGEVVESKGSLVLRVVVYKGDGGLKTLSEIPLGTRALTKDDLEVLRSNLGDEVAELVRNAKQNEPEVVVKAPEPAPPKPVTVVKASPPAVDPPRVAKPVADEPKPVAPAIAAKPSSATDTEDPLIEMAGSDKAETTSDAVSADEIEAMARGDGDRDGGASKPARATTLHLGASVGLGVVARSFAPGPTTVPAYSSSGVGAVHLDAHVAPTASTRLGVTAERTLSMTTPMANGDIADTSMTRWEATAGYVVGHGVAAIVGLGHRGFTINSIDPARSPDGDYNYVIAGATASVPLGSHVTLVGSLAFEPVLWGAEPTEMAFGEASRWAFDVDAAVEARPWTHVLLRAAVGYQRFSWSWDMAGARGAGGATDGYPSGTLSIGAEY